MGLTSADLDVLRRMRWELDTITTEFRLLRARLTLKAGFNRNQPRHPVGSSEGGEWSGGSGRGIGYIRVTQNIPRTPRGGVVGTRWPTATPRQQTELAATQSAADAAIARVRERDRNWQPTSSLYESIDGAISANRAIIAEAERYFRVLQDVGIGPGRYAKGFYIVTRPGRRYSAEEIIKNNINGAENGCHTCGARIPGTLSGNWIHDHQEPTSINPHGTVQRVYPHCASCSVRQGGWIRQYNWRQK